MKENHKRHTRGHHIGLLALAMAASFSSCSSEGARHAPQPPPTPPPQLPAGNPPAVVAPPPVQPVAKPAEDRAAIVQAALAATRRVVSLKQECGSLEPDNIAWRSISAAWEKLRRVEPKDKGFPQAQKLAKQLENCRKKSRAECIRIQTAITGPQGHMISPQQRCDESMREDWGIGFPLVLR